MKWTDHRRTFLFRATLLGQVHRQLSRFAVKNERNGLHSTAARDRDETARVVSRTDTDLGRTRNLSHRCAIPTRSVSILRTRVEPAHSWRLRRERPPAGLPNKGAGPGLRRRSADANRVVEGVEVGELPKKSNRQSQ